MIDDVKPGTRNGETRRDSDGRDYQWDALSDQWRKVPTQEEIDKAPAIIPSSYYA